MVQIICYVGEGEERKVYRSAEFHCTLRQANLTRLQMMLLLTDITDDERTECVLTGRVHMMECVE